jgi:glycogen debranching enzyme
VPAGNRRGFGLYHADTRHLSTYDFSLNGIAPVVLLSTAALGFSEEQVMTNPRMESTEGHALPAGSIEVRRQRVASDVLEETLRVSNYNAFPVSLELKYQFDADFADIFEIRGAVRQQRGKLLPIKVGHDFLVFAYEGLDGKRRETRIGFSPPPALLSASQALFQLDLPRHGHASLRFVVSIDGLEERPPSESRFQFISAEHRRWAEGGTQVFTDNEFFNAALARSLADMRMLWSDDGREQPFTAAGTPWYDTVFGRDSIILSMQSIAYRPDIARDCLRLLAGRQGRKLVPARDEEPGKILHEARRGEMSATGELPYGAYYGSIDSTPLFLWLAAEYYAWTSDLRLMRELRPSLIAALDWLSSYADLDGDGYVEYEKHSATGLVNQGWKDSADSIFHAEGTIARPPIALVEVQGYVYAAKRGLATVFSALGDEERARRLRAEAGAMRRRFNRDFWLADEQFYALALDGEKRPCAVVTSNPGHALWSGIASPGQAAKAVERLLRNDVFSGWGIRTLSTGSVRYNPIGYHLGAVWPHDNAIAAMGFKRYGFEDEVCEVTTALFDAACAFPYYRLPELFGGAPRSAHQAPVPYPVACRPQAWAAGALPMMLHAILGLSANAADKELRIVRPRLPHWLDHVQVKGLRVGRGHVDLSFRRQGMRTQVRVLDSSGGIRVVHARRWSN